MSKLEQTIAELADEIFADAHWPTPRKRRPTNDHLWASSLEREFLKLAMRDAHIFARILRRCVRARSGCWEWQGALADGYGRIKIDGRVALAHRVSAYCVEIVDDIFDPTRTTCVLHRCDNRKCCNPDHLFAGTLSDNMQDCADKGRLGVHRGLSRRR